MTDADLARAQSARASPVWAAAVGVGALALVLRGRAMFTDFWLDEIWSYNLARRARSLVDIFFSPDLKIDNNHHLNTLVLYVLGDQRHWVLYRIPALVAGVTVAVIAFLIGRQRSRADGLISGGVVAGSFIMVVYSTEARGYALVLLFALLAFAALGRYLDAPSWGRAATFWTWIILGLAAQSTIANMYLGALLWSGYRLRGRWADLARLHGVPAVWGVLWAATVLLGSRVGGGPPWTWASVGDQSLAWTMGYPVSAVPVSLAAGLAAAVVIWDAAALWRERSDEGLFFVGAILMPPILAAALSPPWLFPRYFLISLLFLLIVFARSLARVWAMGGAVAKSAVVVTLSLFAAGNLRYIVPFSTHGRGDASEAIRSMSEASIGINQITSQPVDIWTSLPLAFYQHALRLGDRLRYVRQNDVKGGRAGAAGEIEWLVVTNDDGSTQPVPTLTIPDGETYELRGEYPAHEPSGIEWRVYQRVR